MHFFKKNHLKNAWTYSFYTTLFFGLILPTNVKADSQDLVNFSYRTTKLYDNNLFRRSFDEVSDQVTTNDLGISFNKPIGMQRFHANFDVIDTSYNKLSYLDLTAKQYNIGWNWSLTPYLTGVLETNRSERLNDFNFVRSNSQNILTIKTHHFEADFSPHKVAHLLLGFTQTIRENSNSFSFDQQEEISNTNNSISIGAKYDFESAYLKAMYARGHSYRDNPINYSQWIDKSSDSDSYSLLFETTTDRRLNYKLHLGYIDKKYATFDARDFSGVTGDVSVSYALTSKIALNTGLSRSIRSYIRADSSYLEIDTAKINLSYSISPIVSFNTSFLYQEYGYLGNGPLGAVNREDKQSQVSASLSWKPRNYFSSGLSVTRTQRNSSSSNFEFDDTSASINIGLFF